jgi:hypothetical protein
MAIGRRAFIGSALAAALSGIAVLGRTTSLDAVAALAKAAPVIGTDDPKPAPPLVRATFAPHVGTRFSIVDKGKSVAATLTEITEVKGAAAGDQTRFSLVLSAKPGGKLPQGSYLVRNAKLGDQHLFIVPIDRGVRSQQYQILVNSPVG